MAIDHCPSAQGIRGDSLLPVLHGSPARLMDEYSDRYATAPSGRIGRRYIFSPRKGLPRHLMEPILRGIQSIIRRISSWRSLG